MSADEEIASRYRRLVELRTTRDEDKNKAEESDKEYKDYEAEIIEELEDSPIEGSIKLNLGDYGQITFTPRETVYGRVLDADEAKDFFADRGEGDEFVRTKFESGKLNERVRELVEQGKPMPPGIDFYTKRGITISKKTS